MSRGHLSAPTSRDLLFDVDLLAAAAEAGHRIVEVPTIWIDQAGSRVSAVGDSRRMGASLVRLWARAAPPREVAGAGPDVTLICPYPAGGERHGGLSGVAGYTARLADALADAGAGRDRRRPDRARRPARERHGPRARPAPLRARAAALPRAAQAACATGAPVVHLQHETFLTAAPPSVPALPGALRLLRRSRPPTVVTMHHVVEPQTRRPRSSPGCIACARPPPSRARGSPGPDGVRRHADAVVVHEPGLRRGRPGRDRVPHGIE